MSRLLAVPRVSLQSKTLRRVGFTRAISAHSCQPERVLHAFWRAAQAERRHTCQWALRISKPCVTRPLSLTPSTRTVFSDPDRSDLFYHLIQPPNPVSSSNPVYAVSFVSTEIPSPDSKAVMGWVPAGTEGEVSLIGFRENGEPQCTSEQIHYVDTHIYQLFSRKFYMRPFGRVCRKV